MSETVQVAQLSPEDRKKLRGMVREAVDSLTKEQAHKDFRSDVAARAKEELGLQTKVFNRLVKVVFKDELKSLNEENETVNELFEIVNSETSSYD